MRARGGGWSTRRLALCGLGAVLVLLALAQVALPLIAESVISSRVSRYGHVRSVSVRAWPAVELLWGDIESVKVDATSLTLEPQQAAKLLWEAHGASRMEVRAQAVDVGGLQLTDVRLLKHGDAVSAQGSASEAGVRAALPEGVQVSLLGSEAGQVEVRASGALFGIPASVNAVGAASEGSLVVHPLGFLVEGVRLTLFSDPHVYVEGVQASTLRSDPLEYGLRIYGSLR